MQKEMTEAQHQAWIAHLYEIGRRSWTREDNLKAINALRDQSGDPPLTMAEFQHVIDYSAEGKLAEPYEPVAKRQLTLKQRFRNAVIAFRKKS